MSAPANRLGVRHGRWAACLLVMALGNVPHSHAQPGPRPVTADPPGLADTVYQVGVAALDITPSYPVRLSGFGFRREESEGVTQPIWAKALVIQRDHEEPAVLITVDNLGVPDDMVTEVATRLRRKAGILRDRLAVTSTHTHTAPMLKGVAPTLFGVAIPLSHQEHINRYTHELTDSLEQVACRAMAERAPAYLSWGNGTVGFARNRRTHGGPVDHDLPLLVVKDLKGKVRALYVSYACHCVTLSNNRVSGDWAGYAQDLIQRDHPGALALISVGCGADANPSSGVTGDRTGVALEQGAEIAREVKRLLQGYLAPVAGPLTARMARFDLALDQLPTRAEWQEKAKRSGAQGFHARTQLAKLDRGESLARKVAYSVQTWAFSNQLAMVFLPGEVVVDYSLRLKRELDPARLWINAYANDAPCYIPSERVLREGGYEGADAMVYYDKPTRFAPGLEQRIIDAAKSHLVADFRAPFDPAGIAGSGPLSPQQSSATIRTHTDWTIELVAAEPLVADPVAIDFGPDGRLWVAEMHDYPSGVDGQYRPGGRVKVLEDTDGDGKYDAAKVFLDNIPFPTGVTAWRKGVLVCAAPDILYAEDTTGSGKADVVRKLFTGFATHNFQARVNGLAYGLDNWVHGSGGIFGGEIRSFAGGPVHQLTNRDFRLNPDTGAIEPAAGRAQQGRVRDDWGNWFGCDNSNLLRHYPLAEHYLRRNPHVAAPGNDVYVPDYPDSNLLYPVRTTVQMFKLSGPPRRVTAACGVGIYRDELLGKDFYGSALTCEPVNLLVHRLVLQPRGVTFSGRRAPEEAQTELLAASDNWFRPVQVRTGPDGALWVVDMYRQVIEHPRWIPPEDLARLDVRAGHTQGRIYRIYPRDRPPRPICRLDKLNTAALVAALDSPNGPQRDLAQQMLVWRQDKSAAGLLEKLASNSTRAATRLQALCALDGLNGLQAETLLTALADAHAGVRRHAVRLAERQLSHLPAVAAAVLKLLDDPDAQVQLQLAFSLGEWNDERASKALAVLALRHHADPYLLAGVLSSVNKTNLRSIVLAVLHATGNDTARQQLTETFLGLATALGDEGVLSRLLDTITRPNQGQYAAWQLAAFGGMLDALERGSQMFEQAVPSSQRTGLEKLFAQARAAFTDERADESLRIAATRALGRQAKFRVADLRALGDRLTPQNSAALQAAIVTALGRIDHPQVLDTLLHGWPAHTPSQRSQILDVLLSRDAWVRRLLTEIERGRVQAGHIDAARRQSLLNSKTPAVRELASRLLAGTTNPDRKKVLDAYQPVTTMVGDRPRGKGVFALRCASCHKLDGVGSEVGPDLASMATKSPAALLIAVLDPNQAVDARYLLYVAETKDGRVFSGILTAESATSVTLKDQNGRETRLLRNQLATLQNTGKSLMPEGLEKDLSRQDLADLIAYLLEVGPPPKKFAGNEPTPVRPAGDGSVRLLATQCAIYGPSLIFEPHFRNLGYWHSPEDRATWTLQLASTANYDVYLDAACAVDSAGNTFALEGGTRTLQTTINATGGWDRYRYLRLGSLHLDAGVHQLTARAEGRLAGELVDLRGILLVAPGAAVPAARGSGTLTPAEIAETLLDDTRTSVERNQLIRDNPDLAAALVKEMARGLRSDAREEYRRIPWIWRVAIAAGRRNDLPVLHSLLEIALPKLGQPLRDWQAVVIGGGIVNGITQAGAWPRDRIRTLIQREEPLAARWRQALDLAAHMADDERIPPGTRYDALRMLGVATWDLRGRQLTKYLARGAHDELQMGAISALGDMQDKSEEVARALLGGLGHYSKPNRELALDALIRDDSRTGALLDAVAAGQLRGEDLGKKRIWSIRGSQNSRLRERAKSLLP
jgi:putative membrane-bound dehydrogenase-like protein